MYRQCVRPEWCHLKHGDLLAEAQYERLVECLTPPTLPPRRGIARHLEGIARRLWTLWHTVSSRHAHSAQT